ncbi:chromosome replication initiation and membrane attachment protein [Spiroplasma sabaudiense Ar-1343]|uniref:Chromosome replication initiation and membrane attachment protein n=1 Tax=Spiroplasma sabaudiense Ar-1343 TaxID=1276257 RepID=W6AAP6_9MOLU|nr:DnaD domain protein [Spiroplasma sabaudiense]AHI54086.1 chromosome replication initiation and membrane attachment protein [Spiroplasma sabaudiense Ar-1343]
MDFYNYKINLKNTSSAYDFKILQYLYLPIIGPSAFTTFLSLVNENSFQKEFKNGSFDIKRLSKINGIGIVTLEKDFEKLSAMGLLKTLVKKDKTIKIFNVYAPLEPLDFFNNEIFSKALLKKIGKEDFEMTSYMFRDDSIIVGEYEEELANFSEVFKEDAINILELKPEIMKLKPKKTDVFYKNINKDLLIKKLLEQGIEINLQIPSYVKVLKNITVLYQLSTEELFDSILKCYDFENKVLEPKVLFDFVTHQNLPITDANDPKSKEKQKCQEMELIEPLDYLKLLKDQRDLTNNEKNIIKVLEQEFNFKNGFINCLLEFSYYKNSREIVGNYIFKIAQSIQDLQISSTNDLMKYLKTAYLESVKNKQKKRMNSNKTIEAKTPIDWEAGVNPERYEAKFNW